MPDILPANFDFWYPRKLIVSGVVYGNKTTSIPITGKKTEEDVRNEKELKELGFELEDK